MEQNRDQIEALIEEARHRRSVDAGKHLVAGLQLGLKNTLRWINILSQSAREAVHASHKQSIHN